MYYAVGKRIYPLVFLTHISVRTITVIQSLMLPAKLEYISSELLNTYQRQIKKMHTHLQGRR